MTIKMDKEKACHLEEIIQNEITVGNALNVLRNFNIGVVPNHNTKNCPTEWDIVCAYNDGVLLKSSHEKKDKESEGIQTNYQLQLHTIPLEYSFSVEYITKIIPADNE